MRIREAADSTDRCVRVRENYLFYPPLQRHEEIVGSGQLGEISTCHVKMGASGLGGWEVPRDAYERQFEQM